MNMKRPGWAAKCSARPKQGIAPVYGDRYMKYGVQVGALFYPDYLRQEIERCLQLKNQIFEKGIWQACRRP